MKPKKKLISLKKHGTLTLDAKFRSIIKDFQDDWVYTITCLLASLIGKSKIVFYANTKDSRVNVLTNIIKGIEQLDNRNLVCSVNIDTIGSQFLRQNDVVISVILPEPKLISSIEDLFKPTLPSTTKQVTDDMIERANVKLIDIQFSEDAKKMMLNIVNQFQTLCGDAFNRTKIYNSLNFLKAIAFINGDSEIKTEHLMYMNTLWTPLTDAPIFAEIVDGTIHDYNAVATAMRGKVTSMMIKVEAAKKALGSGKPINFYEPTIPVAASMDDLITAALSEITITKAETLALTDGKPKTKTYYKPLFDLLAYIEQNENLLLTAKAIK
jgi:hypothetical protein